MQRTEAFLIAAFAGIVLYAFTADFTPHFLFDVIALGDHYRGIGNRPIPLIESSFNKTELFVARGVLVTLFCIFIGAIMAYAERILADASLRKYAPSLGFLLRETSEIASQINTQDNTAKEWEQALKSILRAICNSFRSESGHRLKGKAFSAAIMKPNNGKLEILHYETTDELFEPDATEQEFSEGEGFCGCAWQEAFPQTGSERRWLRLRRDKRYSKKGSHHNKKRSFLAIPIIRDRSRKDPNNMLIISVSSSSSRDFPYFQSHAETLYRGMVSTRVLVDFLMKKLGH